MVLQVGGWVLGRVPGSERDVSDILRMYVHTCSIFEIFCEDADKVTALCAAPLANAKQILHCKIRTTFRDLESFASLMNIYGITPTNIKTPISNNYSSTDIQTIPLVAHENKRIISFTNYGISNYLEFGIV